MPHVIAYQNMYAQHFPFGDEMKEEKIPNDVEKLFDADLKSTYF